jgi:hypothetical protein
MNSNYTHFETTGNTDEKFDPTFTRHHSNDGGDDFSAVNDVTVNSNTVSGVESMVGMGSTPSANGGNGEVQHSDDLQQAAAAAARLGEVQQVQSQQHPLQQVQVHHNYQIHPPTDDDDKKQESTQESRPYHRPVSTTKRAAQNRNAQRAFRQRKEKYIKDLETKAAETDHLKQTIDELRAENLQLRDYTLALQSRVIELSPTSNQNLANAVNVNAQDATIPPPPVAIFANQTPNKQFQQDK